MEVGFPGCGHRNYVEQARALRDGVAGVGVAFGEWHAALEIVFAGRRAAGGIDCHQRTDELGEGLSRVDGVGEAF